MDIVTLEKIRDTFAINSSNRDSEIAELIPAVSKEFEQELERAFLIAERTEFFDQSPGQRILTLKAFPVTAVSAVHYDFSRVFGADTVISSNDYWVDTERGVIHFEWSRLPGSRVWKVVYTGGMATDTETFIASFPDISNACATEIYYRIQNATTYGQVSASVGGASKTVTRKGRFLDIVQEVLALYQRY